VRAGFRLVLENHPDLDAIAATREITARHPARVLVLTTYDLDESVYDALQAGASGFLLKDNRRNLRCGTAGRPEHRYELVHGDAISPR
jgi:DNA-binding NarL/FixJ family response regulator